MNIQINVDPELRPYIVLSGKETNDLYRDAMKQPDPSAWMTEELNRRGRERKAKEETSNVERMAQDKAFFAALDQWPDSLCCVKTQPWAREDGMRFGHILAEDVKAGRWVVHVENEGPQTFENLDELVKVWSVD